MNKIDLILQQRVNAAPQMKDGVYFVTKSCSCSISIITED